MGLIVEAMLIPGERRLPTGGALRQPSHRIKPAKLSIQSIRLISQSQSPVLPISKCKQTCRRPRDRESDHMIFNSVSAITDGVAATAMPASRKAAILAVAVPLLPLTMAPA